jgi:hypothetical protein
MANRLQTTDRSGRTRERRISRVTLRVSLRRERIAGQAGEQRKRDRADAETGV